MEEGGNATFALTLSSAPTSAVTVNYVTATGTAGSSDYTSTSGSVTFAAGQTSQFVTIATTEDTAFEADETFTVTFSGSSLAESVTATGTITNDDADPSTQVQTFALRTASDAITGGAGDDVISGAIADAESTLTVSDVIDGGAGTDTLSVVFGTSAAGVSLNAATITNVENFVVKNVSGQTFTQDFGLYVGETNINSNVSTSVVTVTNLASGTSFDVTGNGAAANGASNVGYAAAASAADLDLIGGVTAGAITVTGTGLRTQSITSTGASNTTGLITVAATTTSVAIEAETNLTATLTGTVVATLTISGSGDVDLNGANLDATVINIAASAATGDVDVAVGSVAEATNPSTVDIADVTIVTGSGDDDVDVDQVDTARELSVNTGAGDDIITIGTVLVTSSSTLAGDVINGGDGTDTLVGATAILDDFTTAITTVSGIEVLRVSDAVAGTISVANIQAGLDTVTLTAGADANDLGTITFGAGTKVVNIAASNAGTLTINDTGSAITDSVTIRNTATTADDMGDGEALTVGGFETVNIVSTNSTGATSQDFGAITLTADTGGTATLNLSGTNAVTTGAITARVVNASDLTAKATGTATFTMGAAMVGGTSNTITGSAGDDTLVGDTNDTTNINAGAGADGITGGSDAETIQGEDGNDTINGGGGADIIYGGSGNDQITLGGTAETVDAGDGDDTVIAAGNLLFGAAKIGGAGTDTLSTNAAVSAANGSTVSGFEVLTLGTAGTTDLDNFTNNTFTTVNLLAGAAQTVQSVRTQVIQLGGALTGDATITMEDATGAADSVTFKISSAAAVDTTNVVLIAGVETINLVMTDTNTTAHQNTLDLGANSATTINISGNAGVIFATGGNTDIADVITMNASGVVLSAVTALGVTYVATYNTVGGVTAITGSNGVDVLTGGAATNDTISGGAGADTLVYTGGSDVFTGGAGNDLFDINAIGAAAGSLTITDIAVGDRIDLVGITTAGAIADVTATDWNLAEVTLGSAATLANYLDSAASEDGSTNAVAEWFYFGGDTYIVISNDANGVFTAGTDVAIKLTGILDIDGSSITNEVLTIAS